MLKNTIAVILSIVMIGFGTSVVAQSCSQREEVIKNLQETYHEDLVFGGLQKTRDRQMVMEVWASKETGTYTVLLTHANGQSCIVATGTDFFEAMPRKEKPGVPG